MTEHRFPEGVIIDIPEGFMLVNSTTMLDTLPRVLVSIDTEALLWVRLIGSTRSTPDVL